MTHRLDHIIYGIMIGCIIPVFLHSGLFGQNQLNTDSLYRKIFDQPNDSNKVISLNHLSKEVRKTNPGKALEYCNFAAEVASEANYRKGLIDAYHEKSKCFETMGEYDSAYATINRALALSIAIHDNRRYAQNNVVLGNLNYRTRGPEKAIQYYKESFQLYASIHDSAGMANTLNGIGAMYLKQSEYDSAIYYLIKFIKLSEGLGYEQNLGKGFINLGLAYLDLGNHQKAEEYMLASLPINEKYNNPGLSSQAYNLLGALAFNKKDYDQALAYYSSALEIDEKLGNMAGIADRKTNIGNVYDMFSEYEKAFNNYSDAYEIYQKIDKKEGIVISYKNLGWIQYRRKNYDRALLIYDSCLRMAERYHLTPQELEIRANIFQVFETRGDFKNAFNQLIQYYALKDSIFNMEKEEKIADLLLKYDKEKDSVKILTLENEKLLMTDTIRQKTMQRNHYIYTGSGTILAFIFFFAYYRQRTRKNRIIAEQRIKQLEEEKKLLAARSIVEGQEEERKRIARELHDGLGVLLSTAKMQFTTIRDKSPENQSLIEKATKILEQASGDVRRISHNMMPGLLTKYGFYEAVQNLIEEVDESEGMHAVVDMAGECKRLTENTEIMLYRIVQEMVNNTLKHSGAKNIVLKIEVKTNQLRFSYTDDGKGFDLKEKLKSKSIGLTSIQSRVKFLGGELEIFSSVNAGVRYNFQIPC